MQPKFQHASQIRVGLRNRDAGLEPRNTLVGECSQVYLVAIESLRKNQFGIALKAEFLRHDADHGMGRGIDGHRPPENGSVAAEPALPIAVGEDDRLG